MSRFLSPERTSLTPYTPGEQPQDRRYIKLNTNESPFPPSETVCAAAEKAAGYLQLYPDPTCKKLHTAFAERVGVGAENVLATNGSDEILNFAFLAFCDKEKGVAFPDITYGFYKVFADLYGIPCETVPLKEDFSIDVDAFCGINKTLFIANPNAPTGLCLSLPEIEKILVSNPDNVVVIDEAYVDFGGQSTVSLIEKYKNLLVTQTFSKSRSLAGGRLGFGIASKDLIADLTAVKYATNPYNINSLTMAAGLATLAEEPVVQENCRKIAKIRQNSTNALKALGFTCTDSAANFIFARHERLSGAYIYQRLREKGVLVRHFTAPRIEDYNRITVGSESEMAVLAEKLKEILEEIK